jgi:hypothetical protein
MLTLVTELVLWLPMPLIVLLTLISYLRANKKITTDQSNH